MAHKRRTLDQKDFNIHFTQLDMLRIERVLKIAGEAANGLLDSEENEWLSDALMLFAPELPAGEYQIGTSKHDV